LGGDLQVLWRRVDVDHVEDGGLPVIELGAAQHLACGAGEPPDARALQIAAQVLPGVAGGALGDASQQQREPAQRDLGACAVLRPVVDQVPVDVGHEVAPAAFDLQ
jgi:hypothetical protein